VRDFKFAHQLRWRFKSSGMLTPCRLVSRCCCVKGLYCLHHRGQSAHTLRGCLTITIRAPLASWHGVIFYKTSIFKHTKTVVCFKVCVGMGLYQESMTACTTPINLLHCKSEGRWFEPRWYHRIFHWHKSFWSPYGPGVDSASNRNEYQE
jgi:hypothetical protein